MYGVTIPGLYNTGTDASNLALVGGNGVSETHYLVPGFSPATYKNPAYLANDADSRWISSGGDGRGTYVRSFMLTFSLAGFDATTAQITGGWATDNCGTVTLNGVATGQVIAAGGCVSGSHFRQLTPFTINSGFVAGSNILEFLLDNRGGAGAIRVDGIAGTADLLSSTLVPEPAMAGLLGAALAGLALLRRRK